MIINSVIAGVSQGGGGETIEALNRSTSSEVGSKVLINPMSDNIQEGPFKKDSNWVSTYVTTGYDAGTYSAGYGYIDTYFEPNDTLFGCRAYYPPMYSSTNNTGGSVTIPVAKFNDQSNKLSYISERYPMCYPSSFSSAVQLEPNSKYGATLCVSSSGLGTSAIDIKYWNTVTGSYESTTVTNIDVRESNYSYVSGVWSYDWEYLFLYTRYNTDFPYNLQVIKINKDSETGVLSLTKICDDGGVLGNSTSSGKILPSVNDYSFGFSSSNIFNKIYRFTGSSIELVRDTTSTYRFSLLAKDWCLVANHTDLGTGRIYKFNQDNSLSVILSIPNCYSTSSTPLKLKPDGSTNTFSNLDFRRVYTTSIAYTTPQFLYFDNLTLPSSVKVINSQTESRIPSAPGIMGVPFLFKDVIMYQGDVIYKDGIRVESDNTMPIKNTGTSNFYTGSLWNIDEFHNTLIYNTTGDCWSFNDLTTPYYKPTDSIGSGLCLKDFMYNGSVVASPDFQGVSSSGFNNEKSQNGGLFYCSFFNGSSFIKGTSILGGSGMSGYYPRGVIYDDSVIAFSRYIIAMVKVEQDLNNKSFTLNISSDGNYIYTLFNNDKTKVYRFILSSSSTSTSFTKVYVGTPDFDNSTINWDSETESWTCNIPPYPNLYQASSPYGFGDGLAKQIKGGLQYIGRGGYFYLDEENKQLVIRSFPETVTDRVDVSTVLATQVFYDSRFSLITKAGNYLFSYTNNDLSTAIFESFTPNSFSTIIGLNAPYLNITYGYQNLMAGPLYTHGRTYAFECYPTLGYQLYKKRENSTGGYSYVAMDLNPVFFNKESLTGFVEEKAIDSNDNSYVKVKTVTR